MMVVIFGGSCLIGAALPLRFGVIALIPTICVSLAITFAIGVMRGDQAWHPALTMMVIATALQIGYLGGGLLVLLTKNWMHAVHRSGESVPARRTNI